METKGDLRMDIKRLDAAIVGETYPAVLTLAPFSITQIRSSDLEGKRFLDYFYVSKVLNIEESKNNADAILVYLDLVLVKEFKNQDFKIWPLRSLNIPVSFEIKDIKNTDLVAKSFITYETDLSKLSKVNWKAIVLAVIILLVGAFVYWWLKKRGVTSAPVKVNIGKELRISKKHSDFEWLYRNRKVILSYLDGKPQTVIAFKELMNLIEEYQFQPNWKEMDISEFISKKNKVLELYKNGV